MDQRNLGSVLFAVVGVFIAASRLPEIVIHLAVLLGPTPTFPTPSDLASHRLLSVAVFGASLVGVLIGLGLVFMRDRLAHRLFPSATQPVTAPEFQAVALSVVGCYLAVQGLARMGWAGRFEWSGALQLALGLGLFVGARGISKLWSFTHSESVGKK